MAAMGASVRYRPDRRRWYVYTRDARGRQAKAFGDGPEGEAAARRFAAAWEAHQTHADRWLTGPDLPCADVLRSWLAAYGPKLAQSTHETAHGLIENHLVPKLGARDLRDLAEPDLIAFVDETMREGKSAAVCLNALSVLRRVCELHVHEGLLRVNPARGCKGLVARVADRHEPPRRDVDSWTRDEAATLLEHAAAREPFVSPALVLALSTGMRRGEILALEWSDVDFARARITVRQSLVRGKVKGPKSGRIRSVPMAPSLAETLRHVHTVQTAASPWAEAGLVCAAPQGGRWHERNFARAWMRLRTRAGVRPLPFHCTRHTFATLALEAGRSVKWLADVLGHADATITLRTYAHALPAGDDAMGFVPTAGNQTATNGNQTQGEPRKSPEYGARDQVRTGDPQLGKLIVERRKPSQ